ncbi:MAG: hypothetical protein WA208_09150 [Thermoanaerobaculia bacterium]
MKIRSILLTTLLIAAGCAGGSQSSPGVVPPTPGRGAVAVAVVPNPIIARHVSGDSYDFPFEVVVRETGGQPVEVVRVSADVLALGGLRVASETYDAAKIRSLGFSTSIPANGELRYRFAPRKSVPDERLFGGVSADLRVEARDAGGEPLTAHTSVSVTR